MLGSDYFKAKIEEKAGRPSQLDKVGGDRRSERYYRARRRNIDRV